MTLTNPLHRLHSAVLRPSAGDSGDDFTVVTADESHTDALHAMFESMSCDSRRFRFFQAMPTVRREVVRRLCAVDQVQHRCWLARRSDGSVIAEVCTVVPAANSGDHAELAFSVHDDWAGRGIARQMIALAAHDATRRGLVTLGCEVMTDNRRCQSLLEGLGMRFAFQDGCLSGRLPAPMLATAAQLSSTALAA